MRVENKIGHEFESLGKRIMYSYIATYPVFKAVDNGISLDSQKQFYDFMSDILSILYECPNKLGITEEQDQYYENWQMNNSKPTLIKSMEKIEYKFADFVELLIKLGDLGEINDNKLITIKEKLRISKTTQAKLELLGIICEQSKEATILSVDKYPSVFDAWKYYAQRDDKGAKKVSRVVTFIHGRYDNRKFRAVDFFGELVEHPNVLEKLENYLELNQFQYANFEINTNTRYAYVRWSKEYPKKETAYLRIFFDWRKKNQMTFEFRVPLFRIMLNSFNEMDTVMQRFIFGRLKTCDGCGYCTQTDKSGKRSCLAIDLECDDRRLNKCPLYPYFTWNYLNENDLEQMLRLLELSEKTMVAYK